MKEKLPRIFKIITMLAVFAMIFPSIIVYAENDAPKEVAELEKEYVIVLDAGHDLEHVGAHGNGLKEEEINLIITEYCKAELEKYDNITVYVTHEDAACPYPGTIASECNESRCEYAASVNADLFISLHVNSHTDKNRSGYEVIYPNANYLPEFNVTGEILANCIVEELRSTGLGFREIWTRDSTENKKDDENFYPDGTRADYYNVIRNSKYRNILGVIIEHAYISNKNDVKYYLSSEEKLKEFGEADARGIINYLLYLENAEKYAEMEAFVQVKMAGVKDFLAILEEYLRKK